MSTSSIIKKLQLARRFKGMFWDEMWSRKRAAAKDASAFVEPINAEVNAAPAHDDDVMEDDPLFRYRAIKEVVSANLDYSLAESDIREAGDKTDSEAIRDELKRFARAKQTEARAKAVAALRRWADELEIDA